MHPNALLSLISHVLRVMWDFFNTSRRLKSMDFLWSFIGRCFCVLMLAAPAGVAHAANVQINASLDQSGGVVGPLNVVGDDFCPSATTPGCDTSATNTRVRTHDAVSYNVSVQVDPPGDNVFVRVRFKPGLIAGDLPGACDPFNSTITGDGSAGSPSEIYCDLGFRSSFATTFTFVGTVDGRVSNGTVTGLQSIEIGGDSSPTTPANLSGIADQVVTAVPRLNIRKTNHSFVARSRGGVSGVDLTYRYYIGLWDNDRNGNTADDPDPRLGHEDVTSPITWTEDMSNISPNAYFVNCALSQTQAFPYHTLDPIYPHQSVSDTGSTPTCSPSGTTGTATVTVSNADLSLIHFPTQLRSGTAISASHKYAAVGIVRVFVPYSDIEDAGGSLVTTNRFTNFAATSISGQQNFNGTGEDESDNVVSRTLQNRGGSFSHTFRCFLPGDTPPAWCNTYWASAPTNASSVSAGDGVIEPEQTFVSYTYYRNLSFIGDSEADVCTVIDTRYVKPRPKPWAPEPTFCAGQCGTLGTDYVIEYGNNYIATAWRDAAVTPSDAVRNECNATQAQAGWTSDYNAAVAAGDITKVRMRRLTILNPSGTHALGMQLEALNPAGLTGVPNGTLFKTWGTVKATTTTADYRNCSYTSGSYPAPSHSTNSCGDRLALTRALARIDKTTQPSNTVNVVEAGGEVTFELAPTFTSVGGSITENVKIVDDLPAGTNYVTGSAMQNGAPFPPVVTGSPGTGQTLTWDLGTLQVNTPIPPIEFTMSVPSFTAGGTQLVNTARIETIADVSDANERSDTRSVSVTAPKSMLMDKSVNASSITKDGSMTFTVTYDNATNADFNEIDVIDVLPFTGDARFPASNYSGQTELGAITTSSTSIQFYVTKDSTSGLSSDPQDSQNNLSTGSAKWCPMTAARTVNSAATPTSGGGSTLCPSNAQQVTGLRLVDTDPLAAGVDRDFTFVLSTSGNAGDDIYTNQAQGTADTISLSPLSPYASVSVAGEGALDADKSVSLWDPSNSGVYAVPGQDVIYTFTVKNTGDGPIDSGTMVLIDILPGEIEFWNGDIEAGGPNNIPGTDRVGFEQTVGSGVTFASATDVRFTTGASAPTTFAQCNAVAQDETYRPDLTHICFNPKGVLDHGNPDPTITLSIRARIK